MPTVARKTTSSSAAAAKMIFAAALATMCCAATDDDCLHGEEGDDLLIGGEGDDFLDAGSNGVDMLVGDYNCEPCYVNVEIQNANDLDPIEECDIFDMTIDGDGFRVEVGGINGVREFVCEAEVDISAGALHVDIGGGNWNVAFNTDTATTIADFITAHGPIIGGYTLTQSVDGNSLLLTYPTLPVALIPSVSIVGGGVADTVSEQKFEKIFTTDASAAGVVNAFETLIDEWINDSGDTTLSSGDPTPWDVSVTVDVVTICKVDEVFDVTFSGVDAAVPSEHKSRLDGQIGQGDEFTFDITWDDGGPQNQVYTFTYDPADLGAAVSADGIVDTIPELQALANLIAADCNAGINVVADNVDLSNDIPAQALLDAGFAMEVDANGDICLKGPDDKTGQTPLVAVSAADGAFDEILATFGQECFDVDENQNFQEGDEINIDFDFDLDGASETQALFFVSDIDGDLDIDADDVALGIRNTINANYSADLTAAIDPLESTKVVVTADVAGVVGDFDLFSINATEAECLVAQTTDLSTGAADFDLGETLTTFIEDDSIPTSYSIVFAVDLATTLATFVTNHGDAILAAHGVEARVNATDDRLEFVGPDGNTADAGLTFGVPTISGVGDGGSVAMEFPGTYSIPPQKLLHNDLMFFKPLRDSLSCV